MAASTAPHSGARPVEGAGGPRGTGRRQRRSPAARHESRSGLLLSTPCIALYVIFMVGPALYGLAMSFFNSSTLRPGFGGWVGLENYSRVLTEPAFWDSMWNTLHFTLLTAPALVAVAMLLALLVNRMRRGKWFYRFVFFAPGIIPVSSAVIIFGWLYNPQSGLLQDWFTAVGLTPPDFLGDADWAMLSVAVLTVWWSIGFNFILFTAALQDIPREVYEAADIDGASTFQQMKSITIPLLRRTTLLVSMLQVLGSLQVFDQIYQLTAGGPDYATRPVLEYIYDTGFTDYRAGYASAASMVYFLLILLLSLGWQLTSRYLDRRASTPGRRRAA
ncbi:ABC transporter permease subunit [Streptomyces sp. 3MP-14]|uniref:ABC transporter permease subunit n=1 Tax=Streptomyces mimosae TaxID=2586635 RepID=A0A5N6AS06_9ACTN|nr:MULTISPECIES: sugar ABC transporter permease [Streptomyces]KAB8170955.1 ABC transporter permease subunit [Streptomyces mimosae]KAB8179694.1 ABC transporter permease subunit [Streptomyces sp. 3MP-14]